MRHCIYLTSVVDVSGQVVGARSGLRPKELLGRAYQLFKGMNPEEGFGRV